MSDNQNLNNLGEQIKGAVGEALVTGDFKRLNNMISETVNTALSDAGIKASKAWQQKEEWMRSQANAKSNYSQEYWNQIREARLQQQRQQQEQMRARQAQMRAQQAQRNAQVAQARAQQQAQAAQRRALAAKVPVKNIGMVAGILMIVFASIAAIPFLVFFILALTGVLGNPVVWAFLMALAFYFIVDGADKVSLVNRAKRYVDLCGNDFYATVEELSSQTGLSKKKVRKELKKILRKGILPTARMNKQGDCLLLTAEAYQKYVESLQVSIAKSTQGPTPGELVSEARAKQQTELQAMVSEGHEYIKKLRELNDVIEGENISNKLYQLENILKEIFTKVEKEPDQMPRMKKVMEYYLPTTLKLVEAYNEYDKISAPGKEVLEAKEEIEKTLDSINQAFVELLNSLFQESIFDVTTDAQVLQTMLAREGLTKEMELEPVSIKK